MALPAMKPWLVNLPGDFFTTYQFARGPVLGSGMSGDVVLATSLLSPNHKRAVKMLSLLTADGGLANTILFDREVNILQRLSHPYIIKHTISARCPDYLAICTHYCPNGTLTFQLDIVTPELCVKYFVQLACAVRYLNDKLRIVHSDIKPDNIFINVNNDPVLGDFGLSFFIPPGDTVLDMYSLGVSLWCMMFSAEPILGNMYELLDDPNYFEVAPDTQGWSLRYSAASILAELHEHDVHRDLIDSL
ncbi:unnamed protein product [Candidula unifasciata]|uniref:Protein kinase domain-containing protein n=1 Tax=Candidula unifasciata TaxID=100452 RepID=A0A8S3ZMY5_9EUPU|nr:unnamed protein product [Candidula unifasciata]